MLFHTSKLMRINLTLKQFFSKLYFSFKEFGNVDKDFQHLVLKISTTLSKLSLKRIFFLISSLVLILKDFVGIH